MHACVRAWSLAPGGVSGRSIARNDTPPGITHCEVLMYYYCKVLIYYSSWYYVEPRNCNYEGRATVHHRGQDAKRLSNDTPEPWRTTSRASKTSFGRSSAACVAITRCIAYLLRCAADLRIRTCSPFAIANSRCSLIFCTLGSSPHLLHLHIAPQIPLVTANSLVCTHDGLEHPA